MRVRVTVRLRARVSVREMLRMRVWVRARKVRSGPRKNSQDKGTL